MPGQLLAETEQPLSKVMVTELPLLCRFDSKLKRMLWDAPELNCRSVTDPVQLPEGRLAGGLLMVPLQTVLPATCIRLSGRTGELAQLTVAPVIVTITDMLFWTVSPIFWPFVPKLLTARLQDSVVAVGAVVGVSVGGGVKVAVGVSVGGGSVAVAVGVGVLVGGAAVKVGVGVGVLVAGAAVNVAVGVRVLVAGSVWVGV